eukprot:maker-scaffold1366_size45417-snap-gene-0.7 protein:Tk05896 transcript:maker-scaffold1366_size45417-snap-gene-0.7-mRNA-1 annotation:"helicase domino-like"
MAAMAPICADSMTANGQSRSPSAAGPAVAAESAAHHRPARRLQLLSKRKARLKTVAQKYVDAMGELYFLQANQAISDYPQFRRKPHPQFLNFLKSNQAPDDDDDDESTISEQERHELAGLGPVPVDETGALERDMARPLAEILPQNYELEAGPYDDREPSSSSDSESEVSDLDEEYSPAFYNELLDLTTRVEERIVPVRLCHDQRTLYDDFLTEPRNQTRMDTGDFRDIAHILTHLRQICNHPRLCLPGSSASEPFGSSPVSFPRISDLPHHRLVTSALDFDPFRHIDLNSYNLIFLTHESSLTAISSDRIRKFCAPKKLIEELPERTPAPIPPCPVGRLNLEIQQNHPAPGAPRTAGRSFSLSSTPMAASKALKGPGGDKTASGSESRAFHAESLGIIARFNERRCKGMPLYGSDLISALTVINSIKPNLRARTRGSGMGYVNCLNAQSDSKGPVFKCRGDFKYKTRSLANLCSSIQNTQPVPTIPIASQVALVPSYSTTLTKIENRVLPELGQLASKYSLPLVQRHLLLQVPSTSSSSNRLDRLSRASRDRSASAKLAQTDRLLNEIRSRGEKVVLFCEMEEMLHVLQEYLNSIQFPYIFLDGDANKASRLRQLSRFAKRDDLVCILASSKSSSSGLAALLNNISNVIFYDPSPCFAPKEASRWCRLLKRSSRQTLTVYRLMCEGTLEENLMNKSLQERLLIDLRKNPENGVMWKIKKQTLDDLFAISYGDNGIRSSFIPDYKILKPDYEEYVVEHDIFMGNHSQEVKTSNGGGDADWANSGGSKPQDESTLLPLNWLWTNGDGDPCFHVYPPSPHLALGLEMFTLLLAMEAGTTTELGWSWAEDTTTLCGWPPIAEVVTT